MDISKNGNQIIPANLQATAMREKERETNLWTKIKANKKPLILATVGIVGVVTVAGGICFIRNKQSAVDFLALHNERPQGASMGVDEAVSAFQGEIETVLSKRTYSRPTEPFIRTMAEWKHHSSAKAAQAAEMGIDLKSNETLVDFSKKAA